MNEQTKQYVREVSLQVALALNNNKTPEAVKDCLKTIIFEASTEADLTVSDFTLIRELLPNVIEKLKPDYGRGFLHSIAAIVRHDTPAFQEFYDRRLGKESITTATAQPVENDMTDGSAPVKSPFDDYGSAVKTRLQMTETAKEYLAQILVVTGGGCEVPDDKEFAQKNLLAIFEMFINSDDNFSRSALAEDLQGYLFRWTRAHDGANRKWRNDVLAELNFQDPRDGTAAVLKDADATPKEAGQAFAAAQSSERESESESLNALAKQFAAIMRNPNLPTDIYNVLTDEFARVIPSTGTAENILLNLKALSDAERKEREAKNA